MHIRLRGVATIEGFTWSVATVWPRVARGGEWGAGRFSVSPTCALSLEATRRETLEGEWDRHPRG